MFFSWWCYLSNIQYFYSLSTTVEPLGTEQVAVEEYIANEKAELNFEPVKTRGWKFKLNITKCLSNA